MKEGKIIRINKIFREDGKAVCVAADHGLMHGPTKEVLKLKEIVCDVINAGADAVLLSPGMVKKLYHLFKGKRTSILIRGDWISGARISPTTEFLPCTELKRTKIIEPEHALSLGADAIVVYLIVGYDEEYEAINYNACAEIGSKCRKIGLPFVIEPLVIPFVQEIPGIISSSLYEYAARIAKEVGADFLKLEYPLSQEKFKEVIRSTNIPCLILGGEKMEEDEMIKMVEDALTCGAKGIVFGRQILKAQDPYALTKKLVEKIHSQ